MDEIVAFAGDELGFTLLEVGERSFKVPRAEVQGFVTQGYSLGDIVSLFLGKFAGQGLSVSADFLGDSVLFGFPLNESLGTRIIRT